MEPLEILETPELISFLKFFEGDEGDPVHLVLSVHLVHIFQSVHLVQSIHLSQSVQLHSVQHCVQLMLKGCKPNGDINISLILVN